MAKQSITVEYPSTPGAKCLPQHTTNTLVAARKIAKKHTASRRDLNYPDVRIYRGDKFVEYAGPAR